MSGWMSWWGGGANQKKTQAKVKETVIGVKAHLEMLRKKEAHLTRQVEELETQAKAALGKNRNEAKRILQRKIAKEKERDQTTAAIMAMEQQEMALDQANINRERVQQTKSVNEAMQLINKGISVDKVDDMMESIREQTAMNDEIAQAMSAPGMQLEEEDLEEELERLRQEQLDEEMLNTGSVPVSDKLNAMPAAATGELKDKDKANPQESEEEAELRKLQAEMAM